MGNELDLLHVIDKVTIDWVSVTTESKTNIFKQSF